jgi:Ca2+-binding EF-hand superfamily protein
MIRPLSRNSVLRTLLLSVVVAALMAVGSRGSLAASESAGDDALFDRLDADTNGKLAASEIPPEHTRLFSRLVRNGDRDGDSLLSRDEFLAALVPARPEKPMEEKLPTAFPQANAVRYLLLTLDTNPDGIIEADEVPDGLRRVFDDMAERFDDNDNDTLERYELSRGFQGLGQIAARYVARQRIDVESELKKLEKSQGSAINRFDEQPRPFLQTLGDPEQARKAFERLDANRDGNLETDELPEPLRPQLERFIRLADRDRSGAVSQREFLAAAERIARFGQRGRPGMAPDRRTEADRQAGKNSSAETN